MKKKVCIISVFLFGLGIFCNAQRTDWAVSHGGWIGDASRMSKVDNAGNIVIGVYVSPGVQIGDYHSGDYGSQVVVKYDSEGNLIWSYAPQAGLRLTDIAVDCENNIYIIGSYNYWTGSANDLQLSIEDYTYMMKLTSDGEFVWVKTFHNSELRSVFINNDGNIFITGHFIDNMIIGSVTLVSQGDYADFFVARLDGQGNSIWAKSGGGLSADCVYCIEGDDTDNIYIAGTLSTYKAKVDGVECNIGFSGSADFIAKWNSDGQFQWVRNGLLGSNSISKITDITIDAGGNISALGGLYGTGIYGNDTIICMPEANAFFLKYDKDGSIINAFTFGAFVNQRYIPENHSYGRLVSDENNNVYVASVFFDSVLVDKTKLISRGLQDIFLAKFNEIGYLQWIRQIGGDGSEYVGDISLGSDNRIYITGDYCSTSMDLDGITINNNSGNGDEDMYLIALTDTVTENKCPEINARILSGKDYFCEGDSLKLRCEADYGNSYMWKNRENTVANNYDYQHWIKEPGDYLVVVNEKFICPDTTNTIHIQKRSLPSAEISAFPDTVLCTNDTTDLSVEYNIGYDYQWFSGNESLENSVNSVKISIPGKYKCIVDDSYCINSDSISIISGVPVIDLHTSHDTILCPGSIKSLIANSDRSYNYFWYRDNLSLPESISNISITVSGIYKLIVENDWCIASDSITITDGKLPYVELIEDTLILAEEMITVAPDGDPADSYCWYKEGSAWPVGFSMSNQISASGTYYVTVRNSCGYDADTLVVKEKTATDIKEILKEDIVIYPNPTSGVIRIKLQDDFSDNCRISVLNSAGSAIRVKGKRMEDNEYIIELPQNPTGVYILVIENDRGRVTRKITMLK